MKTYLYQWLTQSSVDDIPTEEALLLQCLAKAGAIFHVRTNQPQSLMVPILSPQLTPQN